MIADDAYQDALNYLYSFVDFSRSHQQNLAPEKFNLSRMRSLMDALGNPDKNFKTIHVAGTKGKGSVSAFCATVLQKAGYKTGLYTSPHLKDFEERIQINRQAIPRTELVSLVGKMKPYVAAIPWLTTFEISTAIAFWYFSQHEVDIAVIEVGLGGRLDATNVITPLVSVITSISKDHTYVLGNTLSEIALEKGGILKPGIPAVLAPQREEPKGKLIQIAVERGVPLVQVGSDFQYKIETRTLEGQVLSLWSTKKPSENRVELEIPLLGDHQAENAAAAYLALQAVIESGFNIHDDAIHRGFAETFWAGRFEILQNHPPVIIDAAHNPYSARALKDTLDRYYPDKPMILITGMSADKDIKGMIKAWLPRTVRIVTTQSGHPRAIPPEKLAEEIRKLTDIPVTAKPTATKALNFALEKLLDDQLIIATGSVFEVASIRVAWMERQSIGANT
jgi:dihydrofolate synthase/folylpolyglutamate synthase